MKKKVMVAMSGGVDSSVAALLLREEGFDVVGVTMCFDIAAEKGRRPGCCGPSGIQDARRVARDLKIPHYVLPYGRLLEEKVVLDFISEYISGRTPNPCVRCNQHLKFGHLLAKARVMGLSHLATGHYARLEKSGSSLILKKGVDRKKDQSYFLCCVRAADLRRVLLPLGGMTKEEVRAVARKKGLPVAEKPGSQEICFIPGNDYRAFLKGRLNAACFRSGDVVDRSGKVLGRHKGVFHFTIGQREGLGISAPYPLYVSRLDEKNNRVIVGPKEEVFSSVLVAGELNSFASGNFKKITRVEAKIRYNHPQVPARLTPLTGKKIKVKFEVAQPAVTPGQFVVLYRGDIVLGGAKILENS
ncbi:MAG: tRNA 2-thiouridine(34) synthase MnmA [Candidatus Omnitrophota bacterium]